MNRFIIALTLALILTTSFPAVLCDANSGPPPAIIIAVSGARHNLTMSIGAQTPEREDKPFTSYFIFDQYDLHMSELGLTVIADDKAFNLPISTNMTYRNYFKLDLVKQTLTRVDTLPGTEHIPFLMIISTLLIEGIVFYLFGYRQRRSWQIFLAVNLVTQLALINFLSQGISFADTYIILDLIIGEIGVFVVEMIAFGILLRERGPIRRFSYVILANFLSLFLGGYIISVFSI